MILKLKKISILPFSLILCALHAMVGLALGIIVAMISIVTKDQQAAMGLGAWAIVVFPILNALLGFLTGVLIAWAYNFFAAQLGGVRMEFLEEEKETLTLRTP